MDAYSWFFGGVWIDGLLVAWGGLSFGLQILRPYFKCCKWCKEHGDDEGIKKDVRDREG